MIIERFMTLSFLQANKIITTPNNFKTCNFVLASSCQTEKLSTFIQACCIQNKFNGHYDVLPYDTLAQYLHQKEKPNTHHVFFLLPWDLVPQLNWRRGVTSHTLDYSQAINDAEIFLENIALFKSYNIVYLPAPIPPLGRNNALTKTIQYELCLLVARYRATILASKHFSLTSYLANGCPTAGTQLYDIAHSISEQCRAKQNTSKKVLITDFDNVLWKGVVGEDGLNGITNKAEGIGYIHYIYQTLLKKLKQEGILIAGVTRNDKSLALSPFENKQTYLKEDDFVFIIASYNAKSSQIKTISESLNLPLDSFIFIDDNPLEIEEVSKKLPDVTCMLFPSKTEKHIPFINKVMLYFDGTELTNDDFSRTEMYKSRGLILKESEKHGADLTGYLASLEMQLSYSYCDHSNHQRALQLINKTNQFNLNGKKINEKELLCLLENKEESLITFSLKDKFGEHGQTCCILFNSTSNKVSRFVMSCRVFQRKLEYASLLVLFDILKTNRIIFEHIKTERNIPMQTFLSKCTTFNENSDTFSISKKDFQKRFGEHLNLFEISFADDLN